MQREARLAALTEETLKLRRYRRRVRWFAIIAAVIAVALGQMPWDALVEKQLKQRLANAGVTGLDFRVSDVSFSHVVLSDIAYQGQALQSLALAFRPLELIRGGLGQLQVSDRRFGV